MSILVGMAATDTDRLAAEYSALIESCGLVDRSERGKLALTGPDAAEFLNGQVTNDIVSLHAGEGCYAAFLTHKGKMLGDLRVLALAGADGLELELDTERVALQALFDMIRRFKVGYRVELHKRTLERSLLSLVGPRAREVIATATNDGAARRDGAELGSSEHANACATVAGTPVLVIATEHGVDVLFDAAALTEVSDALLSAGAEPVGQAADEVLRVEQGRPRYGIDLDDATIPQEAGLNERAVNFTKGCYVGQETVARLYYRGKPNRHLRGLQLSGPAAPGDPLSLGEREVGRLGSSVVSPRWGHIGLALVRREAEPGSQLLVGEAVSGGQPVSATVRSLPFSDGPSTWT
jgi:folate-binding protein YgfZ